MACKTEALVRAWCVRAYGITGYYVARSRSQAKARCAAILMEAGYSKDMREAFMAITCKRAPQMDVYVDKATSHGYIPTCYYDLAAYTTISMAPAIQDVLRYTEETCTTAALSTQDIPRHSEVLEDKTGAVIIPFDAYRPHITLKGKHTIHVMSTAYLENIITGKIDIESLDGWKEFVLDIMTSWYKMTRS